MYYFRRSDSMQWMPVIKFGENLRIAFLSIVCPNVRHDVFARDQVVMVFFEEATDLV